MDAHTNTALQVFEPRCGVLYNLDTTAHLVGATRRTVLIYCRCGMVRPQVDTTFGGWYFNAAAIQALRRIEYLRMVEGINLAGIRVIMDLLDHLEQSGQHVSFRRRF